MVGSGTVPYTMSHQTQVQVSLNYDFSLSSALHITAEDSLVQDEKLTMKFKEIIANSSLGILDL